MARSIEEIQAEIYGRIAASSVLSQNLTSTSNVAVWRTIIYVVAYAINLLEQIFDVHTQEVEDRIAETRVHNRRWYREAALAFMFGYSLNPETDTYDLPDDITDEEIEAAKIVANAAPIRMVVDGHGVIRMKLVKMTGDEYAPLNAEELTAFMDYIDQVTDAGSQVLPTSNLPDDLKINIDVYYNAQVLNAAGQRLDGSTLTPVPDAVKSYLKSIDFNGRLILSHLDDVIEAVDGVEVVNFNSAHTKYANWSYDETTQPNAGLVNEIRTPDSGYLKLDEENTIINYIALTEE